MSRTTRHLPIRDRVEHCETLLRDTQKAVDKVNQLVALERLIAFKRNIKNI